MRLDEIGQRDFDEFDFVRLIQAERIGVYRVWNGIELSTTGGCFYKLWCELTIPITRVVTANRKI